MVVLKRGHRDFLCWEAAAGPWKPVSGEGRARRKESVIVVKEIGCPCPSLLGFGHKWSNRPKQASSVGKQANLGVFQGLPGRSKKAILMDMYGHKCPLSRNVS